MERETTQSIATRVQNLSPRTTIYPDSFQPGSIAQVRVSVLDYMRVASINHGNDTGTSDNPSSPEKRESTGEDSGDIRVQGKSGTLFFHSASSFESRWSIDFNCTELQRGTMAWPCSHRTVAMHKWTNTSPTLSHFRHNFSIKVTQFRQVNEKLTCATKFPLECSTGGSR
jgi:hypothetical protein